MIETEKEIKAYIYTYICVCVCVCVCVCDRVLTAMVIDFDSNHLGRWPRLGS